MVTTKGKEKENEYGKKNWYTRHDSANDTSNDKENNKHDETEKLMKNIRNIPADSKLEEKILKETKGEVTDNKTAKKKKNNKIQNKNRTLEGNKYAKKGKIEVVKR